MTIAKKVKSGYARDVAPNLVEPAEKNGATVKPCRGDGFKAFPASRVPPAQRVYGKAKYKAVSLAEAEKNMMARIQGKMPMIKHGIDADIPEEVRQDLRMERRSNQPEPEEAELDSIGDMELNDGGPAEAAASEPAQPAKQYGRPLETSYISKRCRVTLELVDGTMSISAIDVKESKYGLIILLPLNSEGATFIPKPGSDITVSKQDDDGNVMSWPCYFPGTYAELAELKLALMVFVRADS